MKGYFVYNELLHVRCKKFNNWIYRPQGECEVFTPDEVNAIIEVSKTWESKPAYIREGCVPDDTKDVIYIGLLEPIHKIDDGKPKG